MHVAAHEAGHLMGLEDHYKKPHPNQYCLDCREYMETDWKGNIMAQHLGKPEEKNIEELLKKHKYK